MTSRLGIQPGRHAEPPFPPRPGPAVVMFMKRTIQIMIACCFLFSWGTVSTSKSEVAMSVQIDTVHTGSFSMDYYRFGHGKEVLVILPGLSVDSVMKYADAVAEAYSPLTEDFTIYLFDRRKELPALYTVYDMARDTAAAIRRMGIGKVGIFGASQGGMIAMVIAAEYPDLVSRLALGSTAACMDEEHDSVFEKWIRLAKDGNAKDLCLAFGEAVYPPAVFDQYRDALAANAESVTAQDLSRFVILTEGMKGFDITDRLQDIICPVLIIGSKDDAVLGPEGSEQIAEKMKNLPGVALYLYDGYGHAAYDLAPDYKERLLRFLCQK